MKKILAIIGISLLMTGLSVPAFAASVTVPNTIVLGTNVFSGPSFVVSGNFGPSDTISLTAVGTVDLASGQFTANAAGVIVSPALTNTGHNPGQTAPGPNSSPYATLMVIKNGGPLVPFFPADVTTGLGNPTPPTTISASRTLGSLFGGGLANGDTITFRINDINTGDNSGQFSISQTIVGETPVGGQLVPLDYTVLFISGIQSGMMLMIPAIAIVAGAGYFIRTKL